MSDNQGTTTADRAATDAGDLNQPEPAPTPSWNDRARRLAGRVLGVVAVLNEETPRGAIAREVTAAVHLAGPATLILALHRRTGGRRLGLFTGALAAITALNYALRREAVIDRLDDLGDEASLWQDHFGS